MVGVDQQGLPLDRSRTGSKQLVAGSYDDGRRMAGTESF